MAQSRQGAGNLRVIIRVGQEKCCVVFIYHFKGITLISDDFFFRHTVIVSPSV